MTLHFLTPIKGKRIDIDAFPDIVATNIKSISKFKPKNQLTSDSENVKDVHIHLMDFYAGGKMEVVCEIFCKYPIPKKASKSILRIHHSHHGSNQQ